MSQKIRNKLIKNTEERKEGVRNLNKSAFFKILNIIYIVSFSFCFFLLSTTTKAEKLNYSNQQHHYSFTIPQGWVEMSKSKIDEVSQQLADIGAAQFVDYEAGFRPKNNEAFQYPYILVNQHEAGSSSFNQIIHTFESNKFSKIADGKISKYPELLSKASFQDPFVDKDRNIIFMNVDLDIVNVGKVKGLVAFFIGKKELTQLNFYSVKSEYSENLPIFNQVIDSFNYEKGYEYNNQEEGKENYSPSLFNGVLEKASIGLVAGGFFALIFGLFSELKKKKRGE